jgi:hypothetical protein
MAARTDWRTRLASVRRTPAAIEIAALLSFAAVARMTPAKDLQGPVPWWAEPSSSVRFGRAQSA